MSLRTFAMMGAVGLFAMGAAGPTLGAPAPQSWDNLSHVASKKLDAVYLLPGADFRGYTKVQLDTPEVAFRKNFQRDYNSESMDLSERLGDSDIQKMTERVRTGFEEIFRKAYEAAGYQVVSAPGPDVLRVRTGVANLYVSAPDTMSAAASRTYSRDAGTATVVIEARDSVTGALLGRAVDGKTVGDMGPALRNRMTNEADFKEVFERWAKISVSGLDELKARSPIAAPVTASK